MSAEVIILPVVTRLDVPVDRVVNDKVATELASAVVVGYDQNGDFYFASSIASGPEVVWLFELAKRELLKVGKP